NLAAANEMPKPVNSATYAAKQSGHFGIAASTTPGTIQLTARRAARVHGRPAATTFEFCWQQHPLLMRAPVIPPSYNARSSAAGTNVGCFPLARRATAASPM